MFKKNYLYVYKKEIFINMSFIYVTFLKWMQTAGQFCL